MRSRIVCGALLLILLLAGGCQDGPAPADPSILSVPAGEPPTIDGVMDAGEWDGAASGAFARSARRLASPRVTS